MAETGKQQPTDISVKHGSGGQNEPIAIVGMACNFPGAPDLPSFWRLLESGGNAITEGVPGSGVGRIGEFYPESANQNPACRFAALVDDIDLFDADFFRISPVEAQLLDPQQRMVLETVWKALEDALVDPERLRGTRTGVYVGISNNDYRTISLEAGQATEPAASLYTVAGTSFNTAAGRVAFALGLEGPAMAVDTACSSSLFALHQAVASLQRDEADLYVVGGVQAIFLGRLTQLRANARMLSPDGQCKAFDASANGFVRGEGCGMVVLKRLSDAQADGDRIWGVVLGSAVNQDGAAAGMTVPSGAAQERVIEEALLQAGIEPHEVDYLEAHGTGTEVGDPIELNAAAQVYGRGRTPDRPLLVGSVKTNVGHLEPAAGVAGLMKVLLSMHRGVIPKHLHFNTPNPRVDWDSMPIQITSEPTAWPEIAERPHRAGISSYGWSGTNVHVVVEAYPGESPAEVDSGGMPQPAGPTRPVAPEGAKAGLAWAPDSIRYQISSVAESLGPTASGAQPTREGRPARILPLAGKSDAALKGMAKSYLAWLDEQTSPAFAEGAATDRELSDMVWSASVARSHYDFRKGVVFRDALSLRQGLRAVADASDEAPRQTASKVAFVYTGQGNQWAGMGERLYESEPVFRAVLDRCDQLIREERGTSLLDVMFERDGAAGDLDEPQWTQPTVYALECALTALWGSVGIRPSAVLGHSLGEIAAAQAAGVFSLEDGLRLASARGRLLGALPRSGAMAAVFAPAPQVEKAVANWNATHPDADVCVGVDNGTHQVVSGPAEEVHALADQLEAAGLNVRRLRPSPAYHSPLVEPALDDLEAVFDSVPLSTPQTTFISNLTGAAVEANAKLDGTYWRKHARQPVAFRACIESLSALGVDAVIELGPHAVLGPLVSLNWPEDAPIGPSPVVLQSVLRPSWDGSEPERADAYVYAVAGAYEAGLPVDLEGLFAGEERRKVSVPGYAFQRLRYWVTATQRRRPGDAHPLLGTKHESPRGEVMYETEMFPSDPQWLRDHRVYGRVVMPGAVYGAMAATAPLADGSSASTVEELQLHNPLVYPEYDDDGDAAEPGRRLQMIVDAAKAGQPRRFEVYSKGPSDEDWTLHAEGQLSAGAAQPANNERIPPEALTADLQPQDVAAYYRSKAATGIDFGPSLRTVGRLWCEGRDAVGEIALQGGAEGAGDWVNPLLLDGCFQVLSATRTLSGIGGDATYLPFAWERLRLRGPLPERIVCHAQLREVAQADVQDGADAPTPETLTGDLWLYSAEGFVLGELTGFVLKRATRASLLSSTEGLQELLYEVVWRERPLTGRRPSAAALTGPSDVAAATDAFAEYLAGEGVSVDERVAMLADLERLSRSYALAALDRLGWQREAGATVDPAALREELQVLPEHARLFERMLRLLSDAGVLSAAPDGGYVVAVGDRDPLPDEALADPEAFADRTAELHPHGVSEQGLLRRSGSALAQVLRGEVDPLSILFSGEGPGAAQFYFTAPASRASNRLLADAVARAVAEWPQDRRMRIIEVGAGTGSGTSVVLPELPEGNFDYMFTDISAGFFAEAEGRFMDSGHPIEYRPLDIERDPAAQGFDLHSYDLVIAANVLHATRDLPETLSHCRDLLAPSGQLLALENLKGRGWQDMTFGQLDGWWRFSDGYRPNHALASPEVWRQALADTGYVDSAVLGGEHWGDTGPLGSGVIMGRGPEEVTWPAGAWLIAGGDSETARDVARGLAAMGQHVVLTGAATTTAEGIVHIAPDAQDRASWRTVLEDLPTDIPLRGVVHCYALSGHGKDATTEQVADDATRAGGSALALAQALQDADLTPSGGLWLLTIGAQALQRDYMRTGVAELAGAALWGFGKALAREVGYMQPRMIDLDPDAPTPVDTLVDALMFPDRETHVAYRAASRMAARLVRSGEGAMRMPLPEDRDWRLVSTAGEGLDGLHAEPAAPRALEAGEVRVAVEAVGLNFSDVLISVGAVEMDPMLGDEFCGRITEVASDVVERAVGDRVLGLGIGTFRLDVVTRAEMTAPAPEDVPAAALATIPTSFVSAELAFQMSGLQTGDRVLVHTASGGVGLAAIQLVQAAGAEVFATASAPKQAYLRAMGITHVFDSRSTDFSDAVLQATGGEGVTVVLNSLTGPGFVEASLACLAKDGRFIEMGRRDIWTEEQMAEARPDVAYSVLMVDALKRQDPATAGASLRRVMARVAVGELKPLVHTRWPMAEIREAADFMRSARHIGKNVIVMPPLADGRLRADRTYLVTGGLGGIGTVVAGWLADQGAGVIVLNGRRPPDPAAQEAIDALRRQGADVRVELADATDPAAMDAMLARIDRDMPPLAGVIHSVGVLSDGSLGNQTWERFEQVLWPKVLGAWHLHRATLERDLDLFVLFSSVTGVVGNSGQGNHAAANAFLDQLAAYRRSLGLPGQSIAWGAWAGLGEAEEQRGRIERQLEASGTGWISPQQGLRAFGELVRQDMTVGMVAAVDWPVLAENFEERPLFLEELLVDESAEADGAGATSADLLTQLQERPPNDWEELLTAFLQRELQAVLRSPSAPPPTVGFFDLGMDSLMSVELRNRMNRALSGRYVVSNTAVFDYPNVAALSAFLAAELAEALGGAPPAAPSTAAPPARTRAARPDEETIAIVGMACRFPGAPDLASFWRLLESGADAVTDGRTDPGPWQGITGDPAADNPLYRRGGFLEGIDRFDNSFFRISPIEARMMDPQQRILLETTWQALEDAGIDPEGLRGSRTGVYLGIGGSEYREVIAASGQDDLFFGTAGSITAGRVAFVLGLEGPAIPLDTACASSLSAIHQAAAALQRGEVDMALASGVSVTLSLPIVRFHRDIGMLSPTGQCNAFDAAADGFVRGEGCGVLVLKRLSEAEADGDRIWGLVVGSAINQNGASAALPVPNGPAQERVMEDALARAGLDPSEVDYLEAHGTGTNLGDSIELRALASVYGRGREAERPLLVGSVKTNIGHAEWAAGMASVMKAVMAMHKGVIPAHLHFGEPNPNFDWDRMPIRITSEQTPWPLRNGGRLLSAVNSFGLSGTNAHVVLEGYAEADGGADDLAGEGWPAGPEKTATVSMPPDVDDGEVAEVERAERPARVLPLSARSPASLTEMAGKYLAWLDDVEATPASGAGIDRILADAAWTAGTGRRHFEHRAALTFTDAEGLRAALERLASDGVPQSGDGPSAAPKSAFVYPAGDGRRGSDASTLYATEPVVRAVLDTCDRVVREETGASLLDVLLGDGGGGEGADASALERAAHFAAQAALTALWLSVGVRPSAVLGEGIGELAAAYAAGVLGLADGVRLAMALSGPDAELPRPTTSRPTTTMVSAVLGRAVAPSDELGDAHWRKLAGETLALPTRVGALAETGVDLVVVIGPAAGAVEELWRQRAQTAHPVTFVGTAGQSAEVDADGAPRDVRGDGGAERRGGRRRPELVSRGRREGLRSRRDNSLCGALCRRIAAQDLASQLPLPAPQLLGPARKSVVETGRNPELM